MSGSDTPGPIVHFAQIWTVAEWNAFFASLGHKVDDVNGYATNLSVTGLTLNGVPFTAPGVTTSPIGFVIPGKPGIGQVFYISVPFNCTIPPLLVGTTSYSGTLTTLNATFTVNHLAAGNVQTALGTITITNPGHFSALLAGVGGTLAAGDALQVICPVVQDATLADVGITILATRT